MRERRVYLFVLCFEAGLATGLSRFLDPWWTAATLVAGGLLLRPRGHSWIAGVLLLGLGLGVLTRDRAARSCAGRLPAGVLRLALELRDPATDGVARASVLHGCRGEITLRVRSSHPLPAGSRWLVTGRWIPETEFGGRPGGIFVAQELAARGRSRSLEAGLRNWLSGTITRLYGTRSGLVDALVTGRRGEMDPSLKASFARSGLIHLLSISGFHVGVIFGWTVLLLKALRISRHRRIAIATAVVVAYVCFLGWPPPAARAAVLCGSSGWAFYRQRKPSPMVLLGVTCLVVSLMDPWAIFSLGAWLSAGALTGSMLFTRWSDRAIGTGNGWRMLFASIGATFTTAPFTAAAFGSVALAGIGLNFAAIPLAALSVPLVLASLVTAPLAPIAQAFATAGGVGLAGLERLALLGSVIPAGAVLTPTGLIGALPWIGLLGFLLWVIGRRNTSRRAALRLGWGAGLAGFALLLPLHAMASFHDGHGLTLHFLSVGQGDAALLRTPAGRWILVDGGPADERHDAGREVLLPFLVRHGVRRLAAVVLSHAHLDHVGGIPAVLEAIPADLILEPAEPVAEPHYLHMLALAEEQGIRWQAARAGDSLAIDGLVLRILHPDTTWIHWREDLNDDSVVLLLRYGRFEAVLAGDLGVKAESLLAGRVGPIDLLKVGHHGSATSSGTRWLDELEPKAAIISVGPNRYGHPAPSALTRLGEHQVDVWRTDRDGSVTVTLTDSTMTLTGRSRTGRYVLVP